MSQLRLTFPKKLGGLELSEIRHLRQLEDENRRLKHLVADLTLGLNVCET